ncbi:MAG TPA: ferrous iron transport protein B [Gemmataceae bacterium]|nr:ferrous iron transport protein B [Gemmataceae bacterium]
MGKPRTLTVALVGNPNTGKSTLFNALTGLRQHVGNYPGVTVEMKTGTARAGDADAEFQLIDLPGTYSLAPRSPDEMVSVDLLLGHIPSEPRPDVIVSIVDASNLERHLYLTTQLMELGVPVVLAVNLIDVAKRHGIEIDYPALEGRLDIPVVPVQANKEFGLDRLTTAVLGAAGGPPPTGGPKFPDAFRHEVEALRPALGAGVEPYLATRLLLDMGGHTEKQLVARLGPGLLQTVEAARTRLSAAGCPIPAVEARTRYTWIRQLTGGVVRRPARRPATWRDRLDRVLTHKVWGTLIFFALMFILFEAIFVGAQPLMDLIDGGFEWLGDGVKAVMAPGPFRSLLADGVIAGVGGVLVFLPQILILFAAIAVLEDCGYMARAAFLMDKVMARCGLNGKSFIPLLSSVACAIPGIMATRVIENRRDRLATILVAPLMSCSARLPLYLLLIGTFLSDPWWLPGVALFGMYLIGFVTAPLVALLLKRTLLRGETPVFVMEMPAFKVPQLRAVLRRMFDSGWAFVYRAGTIILASMILVWASLYFPSGMSDGRSYDTAVEELRAEADALPDGEEKDAKGQEANDLYGEWKRQSALGRVGLALDPVFAPLGWDWKIGMAAIASFPAREVIVGTMGIVYNRGEVDEGDSGEFGKAIQDEWAKEPRIGRYSVPVALGLLVFFALCCQCASTLAVIWRETRSWAWPVFTFAYMTVLAYLGALVTFQVGKLIVG